MAVIKGGNSQLGEHAKKQGSPEVLKGRKVQTIITKAAGRLLKTDEGRASVKTGKMCTSVEVGKLDLGASLGLTSS